MLWPGISLSLIVAPLKRLNCWTMALIGLRWRKRTDTDWTTLEENDVLCSIVNSLLIGGTDYYTSWFRPVSKNRNDNTLTVVLYPDSEVPGGKNYPPVEGYNVTRKGNAKVPDAGEAPNERAQKLADIFP